MINVNTWAGAGDPESWVRVLAAAASLLQTLEVLLEYFPLVDMSLERIQLSHLRPGLVHQITESLGDIRGDILQGVQPPATLCTPAPLVHADQMTRLRSLGWNWLQTLTLANFGSGSDQSWQLRKRGQPDWENILINSIRMKTVDKVWDYPESGVQTNFIKRHNINWISM